VDLVPYRGEPTLGPRITDLLDRRPASGPARIEIRCLGRFEVHRGGVPVQQKDWPRTTARRLLQYLAVTHRPAHREQIMDALWPDVGAREAANQLRVALSALRRALEPTRPPRQQSTLLLTQGGTVALARDLMQLDVDAFRQAVREARQASDDDRPAALQRAAGLYGGDLLADSPYEEWAAGDRDRLLEDYLGVRTSLGEVEEAAGAWDRALANWQEVRTRNPGAEHAYRGLMRCYLALGRAGEAAGAFDACRAALEDLGVPLSEETLRLRETFTLPPSASV
jgi:DNA-binding SARP family transcriptional activator